MHWRMSLMGNSCLLISKPKLTYETYQTCGKGWYLAQWHYNLCSQLFVNHFLLVTFRQSNCLVTFCWLQNFRPNSLATFSPLASQFRGQVSAPAESAPVDGILLNSLGSMILQDRICCSWCGSPLNFTGHNEPARATWIRYVVFLFWVRQCLLVAEQLFKHRRVCA